jgi:hypothetical protein
LNQGVPKSLKKQTSRIGKHLERQSSAAIATGTPQVDLEANFAKLDAQELNEQDRAKAGSLYSQSRMDIREVTTVGAQSTMRDSLPQSFEQDILNANKDRTNLRSSSRSNN